MGPTTTWRCSDDAPALTHEARLPWVSGDSSLSWPSGGDTVDSEAFPITDIKEEPETPVASSSDGESQPRSGEVSPVRDEASFPSAAGAAVTSHYRSRCRVKPQRF